MRTGAGACARELDRKRDRLLLRLDDRFGAQVLRAAEDVKADELERQRAQARAARAGTRSASMPNCFGPPPIFMPEVFSSKSGLTRIATCGRLPVSLAMPREARELAAPIRR